MRTTLVLAATAALALAAGQASAHARLVQSSPKAGATVAAPKEIRLTYSESVVAAGSSVKLAGPAGAAAGPLAIDPKNKRVVVVPLTGKVVPGAYKVTWSAHSEDGHTMDGDFGFKVK